MLAKLSVDKEFRALIPLLTQGERVILQESIVAEGCRDAIVVWNGIIVDGHNRYEICRDNGIEFKTVEREFQSRDEAKVWIIQNQFGRRNLNDFQRAELALRLEPLIASRGKDNQRLGGISSGRGMDKKVGQNSAKAIEPVNTRKELAKIAGVSHDTMSKVKKIQNKASEKDVERLQAGKVSINQIYRNITKQERTMAARNAPRPELPEGKYNIIYADPPWRYIDADNPRGGAAKHYNTMSIDEIKKLPVSHLAAEQCFLFLWVTFPMLPEGLEVIKAWGFHYKTLAFNWIKLNKNTQSSQGTSIEDTNDDFMGAGHFTRANSEICLLSVKGEKLSRFVIDHSVRSLIQAPREDHSRKPAETRERIVKLLGPLPRIELFARDHVEGWDAWGNEVWEGDNMKLACNEQ